MTPAETATILRQFNKWLRGNKDDPQLESREINQAINAAIEMIERLEAAEKERDDVAQQLVQSEQGKRKISEECDTLRVKIAAMESALWAFDNAWRTKLTPTPGAKGE